MLKLLEYVDFSAALITAWIASLFVKNTGKNQFPSADERRKAQQILKARRKHGNAALIQGIINLINQEFDLQSDKSSVTTSTEDLSPDAVKIIRKTFEDNGYDVKITSNKITVSYKKD